MEYLLRFFVEVVWRILRKTSKHKEKQHGIAEKTDLCLCGGMRIFNFNLLRGFSII